MIFASRPVRVALLVGIGVGLHISYRSLSARLPELFPHLRAEITRVVEPPPLPGPIPEQSGENLEPVVLKRSGVEVRNHHLRTPPPLLHSTPIPLLPELDPSDAGQNFFPCPLEIRPAVEFWKKIYGVYNTDQVVIHDSRHLDIQYALLDFSNLSQNRRIEGSEKKKIRESEIADEIKRITETLFDEETRSRIRAQVGLKDKFLEALQRSGRYLPLFEEIFEGYGIPTKITRLAFVESLFKERAVSSVGAAGLWQFMPSTGKKYLTINHLIDERYDPVLATHAAARLLRKNYELLGTWPLAINAYNSGAGHLLRAIDRLRTTDIGAIVWKYRHPGYAFASRNFYPEFLAALEVSENEREYFGRVPKDPMLEFDVVEIPVTLSLPEIASLSGVPIDELKDLHPAFAGPVFEGRYALPAGTEIRLPKGVYNRFTARFIERFMAGQAPFERPDREILASE